MPDIKEIPLPFPLHGVHEDSAVSAQPEGTSPAATNARGYDLVTRRDRGCQRVGFFKVGTWTNDEDAAIDQVRSAFLGPEVFTGGIDYSYDSATMIAKGVGQWQTGSAGSAYDGSDTTTDPCPVPQAFPASDFQLFCNADAGGGAGTLTVNPTMEAAPFGNPPPAIFTSGTARIGSSEVDFSIDVSINTATSSSLDLWFNVDFDFWDTDVNAWHFQKLHVKRTTATLHLNSQGTVHQYVHTYNLSNTTPTDVHTYALKATDTGFTLTIDGTSYLSHTFNTTELTALGGWTDTVSPSIYMEAGHNGAGGCENLYDNISIVAGAPPANVDVVGEKVVVASGGQIFTGDVDAGWTECDASSLTDGSGNAYITGSEISICPGFGFFWLVDGQMALRRIDAASNVITEPSATEGTLPTGARLLALYRGRLFHSRFTDDSFNYIASRSGDLLDYDAGALDPDGSFAGNDTQYAGLIGDTITAMVPYGDVSMIMGMASSIAVMRGDPKAGGSIDMLSREVGVAGPTAWARSPDGDFFFMARDGLYRIGGDATNRLDLYGGVASAQPKPMSRGRLDRTLGQIDFTATRVAMCWDPLELGLKILLIPANLTQPITSIFWEQRKDAFWIDTLAFDSGPNCVEPLRGSGGPGGVLLYGGRDGWLRHMDAAASDDDGTAITSSVRYAPVMPSGDMVLAKIQAMRLLWGTNPNDSPFNAIYSLAAGNDPVSATANADAAQWSHQGTITQGGYQSLDRQRSRGNSFVFQIDNAADGSAWAIERGSLLIAPTGKVRA